MDPQQSSERLVYTFSFEGETINIQYIHREMHKLEGVGVTLWPASIALVTYLLKRHGRDYFTKLRVLELGAGVGLVGISLARVGAEVTLTDAGNTYAPGVLDLLRENVGGNLNLTPEEACCVLLAYDLTLKLRPHSAFDVV
jgi:predicted nicotinamide N-methyase